MSNTPRLALPYLSTAQAQKELAHNAALNQLDVMTQPVVQAQQNDPPSTPENGQAWIVGDVPTGAWATHAKAIAYYLDGWFFYPAFEGMGFFNIATSKDQKYLSGVWKTSTATYA